ncbi:MAG: hypothetical protein RLZZ65_1176 [Bacteroidota bacterium]|jgi:hypothetical protein
MQVAPEVLSLLILIVSTIFVGAWALDAHTHAGIAHQDISDPELKTHRILILSSGLMQFTLLLFYWFDVEVLPFFIALIFTRTIHEVIDEVRYHQERCTFYETILHFVMWISIISQVGFLFYWGFFFHYKGLETLPVYHIVWAFVLVVLMALIGAKEWFLSTVKK